MSENKNGWSRRAFISNGLAVTAGGALIGVGAIAQMGDSHPTPPVIPSSAASQPNLVIIYCDDLGYGDLGCYGSRAIRTPNIDKMAEEGVRFTDYYSCNGICAPSRAGLLTGRYPYRSGVIGNHLQGDVAVTGIAVPNPGHVGGEVNNGQD